MLWVGIILAIIAILVIWIISVYNLLVQGKNKVKNAFAQIDTQLQRRFDLIPNLVEVVKGYAAHEKELLENVTKARTSYVNASSNADKIAAENQLTSTLKTLFAVAENYPDLKANTNFAKLQEDLSETEDKVTFSRQFYNDTVTRYNNILAVFPNNIVAGMFHFSEEALFKVSTEEVREAPKVQF